MGRKEGIETYTRSRLIGYAQLLQEIAQEYKAGQKRTEGAEEACLPRSSLLLREQELINRLLLILLWRRGKCTHLCGAFDDR